LVPWYLYVAFIAFVLAMLLIDLRFFHAEEHNPTPKESATWVGIWVTLALAFGVGVFFWKGTETGIEYFAGYLLEYSLSVDNMFVFVLIFTYFQVPFAYQHQVLFYGILGAMIFRGLFIAAGHITVDSIDLMGARMCSSPGGGNHLIRSNCSKGSIRNWRRSSSRPFGPATPAACAARETFGWRKLTALAGGTR
jgi:hypothetical protein